MASVPLRDLFRRSAGHLRASCAILASLQGFFELALNSERRTAEASLYKQPIE